MNKMGLPAVLAACLAGGAAGCVKVKRVPFVSSSLSANQGTAHAVELSAASLEEVSDRAIELFARRGAAVTGRSCQGDVCDLVFKSDGEAKTLTVSRKETTTTEHGEPDVVDRLLRTEPDRKETTVRTEKRVHMARQSKIFVRIMQRDDGVRIEAVGVPVLNGEQACPPYVAQEYEACSPPLLQTVGNLSLTDGVRQQWGHDISGAVEADLIGGVLAELQ